MSRHATKHCYKLSLQVLYGNVTVYSAACRECLSAP